MEDALYRFLGIYKKSPDWVKAVAGSLYGQLPYGIRYGKEYEKFKEIASRTKYWTPSQHREYQVDKLKKILQYSCDHIPYYRNKYRKAGVGPADFKTLEDIKKIPCLSREEIRHNFSDLTSSDLPSGKRLYTATSGSSGVPLELFHHKGITRSKERAFLQDLWQDFGCRQSDKKVIFRGEVINNQQEPWYYDPTDRHLIMSSYLLSADSISAYCKKIRSVEPSTIRGYPFMIFRLAQLMMNKGERPFPLQTIILESENIYAAHLDFIKEFFNCTVCHYYGHTERLAFGGNCHLSEQYHLHPEYGFVEVITEDGEWAKEGEEGEIVATGFDNMVMPLIRYRTEDFAIRGGDSCECGRQFPMLKKIMGRAEDYVYLTNGKKIPFHNLLAGIHGKTWSFASKLQCRQSRPGQLDLQVVPSPGVNADEAIEVFLNEIKKRVDPNQLNIKGCVVSEIPKIKSGKTKLFIQDMAQN